MLLAVLLLLFAEAGSQGVCKRRISLHYAERFSFSFSPDHHQPWLSCLYIVTSPLRTSIKLSCRDANLPPVQNCDKIRILVSKLGNETMGDAVSHCGPASFFELSLRNQMVVQLQSNSSITPEHHICTFSQEFALEPDYICVEDLTLQIFQRQIMYFEQDHYQASRACRYHVRSPDGTHVKLSCTHANLPPAEFCDDDKISVSRTGDQALSNAVSHCGPAAFEEYSEKNEMVVAIQLGAENVKGSHYCIVSVDGFSPENNTCFHQTQLGRNETYNLSLYPDEAKEFKSCRWEMSSPPGTRISVSCSYPYFPPMDNCSKDKISVYRTGNDTLEPRVYCGNESFTESSVGNELILELEISRAAFLSHGFYTCDFSVRDSGASLYEGCDHIIHVTKEGETAPLFSKPYSTQQPFQPHDCRYIVVSPIGTRIFLSCPLPNRGSEFGYQENPCLGKFSVYKTGMDQTENATEYCDLNGFADSSVSNELKVVYSVRSLSRPAYVCYASVITPDTPDEQECDCGRRNTARIIGGQKTIMNEFPMMAALANATDRKFFCGAVIISHRYALTVAHCVYKRIFPRYQLHHNGSTVPSGELKPVNEIILIVGAWKLGVYEPAKRYIGIDQIIIHEKNIEGVFKNEIALVHLNKSIVFNHNVGPACLPFNYRNNRFFGEKVWQMGWGDVKRQPVHIFDTFNPIRSDFLNKIEVKVYSPEQNRECINSEEIMCTYQLGSGICKGDSGGPTAWTDPLKSKMILVGLNAASIKCSLGMSFETRVAYHLDWIEQHTQDAKFCRV